MIQNLILSIGLSFAIGLNGAKDNHDNFINNETPNNVVYVDEDYSFTLQNNELNYEYTNLWQSNTIGLTSIELSYNESNWSLNYNNQYLVSDGFVYWDTQGIDVSILFVVDKTLYIPNNEPDFEAENYHFYIKQLPIDEEEYYSGNIYPTITSIEFQDNGFGSNTWADLKTALNLDIVANTTQPSMGNTIINAIKSGLGLIGDLASQFLLGFSTLFWANNALTPFGTFALVFLGISITMAVVSLVLKLIRGNTGA